MRCVWRSLPSRRLLLLLLPMLQRRFRRWLHRSRAPIACLPRAALLRPSSVWVLCVAGDTAGQFNVNGCVDAREHAARRCCCALPSFRNVHRRFRHAHPNPNSSGPTTHIHPHHRAMHAAAAALRRRRPQPLLPLLDRRRRAFLCSRSSSSSSSSSEDAYLETWQRRQVRPQAFYEAEGKHRRWMYTVDLQGRLFLEELRKKDLTSCLKNDKARA